MKAVIMAGGAGTRLRPLTCDIPKPMVSILDKPMMEYIIELLKRHGIKDIAVTLQYLPQSIMSYFGNGEDFGVNIQYFIEETPLGTAGSVKNAEEFLDETFVIISGDALTDMDLSKLAERHKSCGAGLTIALKHMNIPLEYGVVVTDDSDKIIRFLEKPNWDEVFSDTVNTGIYVLEPEVLSYIPENQVFDFSKDLFPLLQKNDYPLYGYVSEDYWCDVGNLQEYRNAQYDVLDGKVNVEINAKESSPGIWIHPDAFIEAGAFINSPCYIGRNAQIFSGASVDSYSVIGRRCRIYGSAKYAVVWENSFLGHDAALRASIIGRNVKLEENSAVYQDCVIGDDCILEKGAYIAPGVKVWPNKSIARNSRVISDIIWESSSKTNIFSEEGITGELNITVTPVMVTALCEAYASVEKNNASICIACHDRGAAGDMLLDSASAGLMSAECNIYRCGNIPLCVMRYCVRALGADGGVHIDIDKNSVCITLIDNNGADITRSMERKIQNAYWRAEYTKGQASGIKPVKHISDAKLFYLQSLISELGSVEENSKKIIASGDEELCDMLRQALRNVCEVQVVKQNRLVHALAAEKRNALFGIEITDSCRYKLIDPIKGEELSRYTVNEITAYIAIDNVRSCAYIDLTMPRSLEQLAVSKGLEVVKTGVSRKDFMKRKSSITDAVKTFNLSYDSVYAGAHIAQYLINNGLSLNDVAEKVTDGSIHEETLRCGNDHKGRVIKNVMKMGSEYKQEQHDGVKIFRDGGWVLVLPDAYEDSIHVIAGGADAEFANELCFDMRDMISKWIG